MKAHTTSITKGPAAKTGGKKRLSEKEKKAMLLDMFTDFIKHDDVDGLFDYMDHVGLEVGAMPPGTDGPMLFEYFCANYTKGRKIDIDRAANDLATFPPIAVEIVRQLHSEGRELSS